jgi:hypothetical protein
MKVLFLDVDGVLLTRASAMYFAWLQRNGPDPTKGWRLWCPIATNNLRRLLADEPDLMVVLSSSWRTGRTLEECKDLFRENDLDPDRMIGRTGAARDKRGHEIQAWLDHHPEVTRFVIVDDDSDMEHLEAFHVKTDFAVGLTLLHNETIKMILHPPAHSLQAA